jgi:REP element-mobilizing transposase RayT
VTAPSPITLHPLAVIDRHTTLLPHWQQGETTLFATFRTADSLPQSKLVPLAEARAAWQMLHPPPWTPEQEHQYHAQFTDQIERWLDQGEGECPLRDRRCADLVGAALDHFHGTRYTRHAWVVMPNHVHVLFSPLGGHRMEEIIHSWKSFTAHGLNRLLGRSGPFWQRDYHDRLIRSQQHFDHCVRYIRDNPAAARLAAGGYLLWPQCDA